MKRIAIALLPLLAVWPAAAAATPGPWFAPGRAVVSPDGRDLYAAGYQTLSFRRDENSGALTQNEFIGPHGSTVAITPDGAWVFVGSGDYARRSGAIHVLSRDASSGHLTHEYSFVDDPSSHIAPGEVTDLAVSPDGRFLYVSQDRENAIVVLAIDGATGGLQLVQALYGGEDGEPGLGNSPRDLALSPDGANLYVAAGQVLSYSRDQSTGRLTPLPSPKNDIFYDVKRIEVAPDGKRVYAAHRDLAVFDRDPADGSLTGREAVQLEGCQSCAAPGPIAISPDGRAILFVHAAEGRLLQATPADSGPTAVRSYDSLPGGNDGDGIVWSPDGRFAYVIGDDRATPDGTFRPPFVTLGGIATFRRDGDDLTSIPSPEPVSAVPNFGTTPSVSINGGAIYTNDPHVRLDVTVEGWIAASFRVSNTPEFKGVRATRATDQKASYDWLLDTSAGPVRSVKHVWVSFTSDGFWPGSTVSDDIILDQKPPQVVAASLKRVGARTRVTLKARDNRSGVRRVQVTRDRHKPGRALKFARRLLVPGAPRKLYVRVRDGAGNYSAWRSARR